MALFLQGLSEMSCVKFRGGVFLACEKPVLLSVLNVPSGEERKETTVFSVFLFCFVFFRLGVFNIFKN